MVLECENKDEINKYLSVKMHDNLSKAFVMISIIFGLMFILLEPPFAVSDEHTHYTNICRISHGNIFGDVKEGIVGSYITKEEKNFVTKYCDIPNMHSNFEVMRTLTHRPASKKFVFYENASATLNPIPYILPAFVIMIIRATGLAVNGYNGYLIAKLVNLFFYIIITRWALLNTKVLKKTMFILALMPMTIFQAASTSYDAYLIPSAFLFFSYLTKLWFVEEMKIEYREIIAICISAIFLVCCKIAYAPLLVLLLLIPMKRYKSWKQYIFCVGCVMCIVLVTYIIPSIITSRSILSRVDSGLSLEQLYQKEFVQTNFIRFLKVIVYTLKENWYTYLESFVGTLGWMNTPFPKPFILLFYMFLGYIIVIELGNICGLKVVQRVLMLICSAFFLIGSLYVMYVEWTPVAFNEVGGKLIYGFQGRYMIPVILFMILPFGSKILNKCSKIQVKHLDLEYTCIYTSIVVMSLTLVLLLLKFVA